jgi:hypothetical protein
MSRVVRLTFSLFDDRRIHVALQRHFRQDIDYDSIIDRRLVVEAIVSPLSGKHRREERCVFW